MSVPAVTVFNDSLLIGGAVEDFDIELFSDDGTGSAPRQVSTSLDNGFASRFMVGDSMAYFLTESFSIIKQLYVYDLTRATPPAQAFVIDSIVVVNATDTDLGSVTVYATGDNLTFSMAEQVLIDGNVFSNLEPDLYTLEIFDAYGCQEVIDVVVDFTSGVSERPFDSGYTVFPNPGKAGEAITIRQLPDTPICTRVEMYDMTGKRVGQYSTSEQLAFLSDTGNWLLVGFDEDGNTLFRRILVTVE